MREILFRGKRLDNGEWVEGHLVVKNDPLLETSYCFILAQGRGESFVTWHKVDPSTVGQYTGLKDKNGKRIFEGDRVVYPDSVSYSSYGDYNDGVVDYDEEVMRFYFTNRWSVEMEDFEVVDGMMVDIEIIGNIHDNPELVKGGEDNY